VWQFGSYPPVRGEQNMKNAVIESKKMQDEIMDACYAFKDSKVETDASGFVNDDEETEI
jgi:hypothetical protein